MNISILGTRGIPNNYGGFEECAEYISKWLVQQGHQVTVYCPDYHPNKEKLWEGVRLKRIFSKENKIGTLGNLMYEFLSIRDAVNSDCDVILELGTEFSLFSPLFRKGKKILVTNVDGLETRRDKWSGLAKYIIRLSEVNAIKLSNAIVSDNPEIKLHVDSLYNISSHYIGYGAIPRDQRTDINEEKTLLQEFNVQPYSYCILIARLEPENNIEMIIEGHLSAGVQKQLVVVGPTKKKYGQYIYEKYHGSDKVKFLGGVYNRKAGLDALRRYAHLYYHGHSVGGTNPALLQAMAQGAMIMAHDNKFNRYVLGENAHFFKSITDLAYSIKNFENAKRDIFAVNNFKRLEIEFNWNIISKTYLDLFENLLSKKN